MPDFAVGVQNTFIAPNCMLFLMNVYSNRLSFPANSLTVGITPHTGYNRKPGGTVACGDSYEAKITIVVFEVRKNAQSKVFMKDCFGYRSHATQKKFGFSLLGCDEWSFRTR